MKRIGPELKMPELSELKVPPFLSDLYYDMRSRGLLPIVGLVLVAIVAVPFLLGGGSEEEEPVVAPQTAPAPSATASASSAHLTVVEEQNGLRDYRKRLSHRKPTDPFKQRFTASESKGPELQHTELQGGSSSGGGEGSVGGESGGGEPTGESPSPGPSSGGGSHPEGGSNSGGGHSGGGSHSGGVPGEKGGEPSSATLYTFGIDVKIVHSSGSRADGNKETGQVETRNKVLPTTPLPSKKVEVVNYIGLSPKTRKPLFVVSTDVTGVFGEAKCASGSSVCQLIELEPGYPETFVYGEHGDRYKIKVTDVHFVVTGHT